MKPCSVSKCCILASAEKQLIEHLFKSGNNHQKRHTQLIFATTFDGRGKGPRVWLRDTYGLTADSKTRTRLAIDLLGHRGTPPPPKPHDANFVSHFAEHCTKTLSKVITRCDALQAARQSRVVKASLKAQTEILCKPLGNVTPSRLNEISVDIAATLEGIVTLRAAHVESRLK